jgi:UDP-N-acetylmuramoyl-L-alanyl-D-glutamate--2,6-diaminopimelate ligase
VSERHELDRLLGAVPGIRRLRSGDAVVSGVTCDSREVTPGDLMVCIRGTASDGHRHAAEAIARGASALVVEREIPEAANVPSAAVPDGRLALALIADRFYGHPSAALDVVGVTGTDGKTTIVNLAASIGEAAGWKPGVIGTLGIRRGTRVDPSSNTTPGAHRFHRALREMLDAGSRSAMVEVSSHALDMHRTAGTEFRAVVLSNFSRDHLDWHGSIDAYRAAKAKLFRRSEWHVDGEAAGGRPARAFLPADDPSGDWFAARTDLPITRFGFRESSDWRIGAPRLLSDRSLARLEGPGVEIPIEIPLPGRFNLLNAAAAAAVCDFLGAPRDAIAAGLGGVATIPGRMERVERGQPFLVLVDYAHTPDALSRVLDAVRELTSGRVICVVGCGGDRDRGKRPEMARVVLDRADEAIFTSDNPRSEDPDAILDEMIGGLRDDGRWRRIRDRRAAVTAAVASAAPGDTVLIAGKGHETYQEIAGRRFPSDDRRLASDALASSGYGGLDTETEG